MSVRKDSVFHTRVPTSSAARTCDLGVALKSLEGITLYDLSAHQVSHFDAGNKDRDSLKREMGNPQPSPSMH